MEEDSYDRRRTDHRIDDLINEVSTDPVQRAIVIVLAAINRDLIENTRATQDLATGVELANQSASALDKRITQHMLDEEVMLAGFKGRASIAVWIAPFLFTVLGALGSYIWATQKDQIRDLAQDLRDTKTTLYEVRQVQQVVIQRTSELERRQLSNEGLLRMQEQDRAAAKTMPSLSDPPSKWRNSGSVR